MKNPEIKIQIVKMADLVDYQKDSIVSREIVKKNGGTVTIFAFDKGQGLSEHKAPFDVLVYIIDGKAKITIAGKVFELKKGEIVTMPANQPHAVMAENKFKMMLIMIRA